MNAVIKATSGEKILVSDEDAAIADTCRIYVDYLPSDRKRVFCYSRRKTRYLVAVILERQSIQIPKGFCVKVKNGNDLDLTRENLELITKAQNIKERLSPRGQKRFIGVTFSKNRFRVRIQSKGKTVEESGFITEEDAAEGYDFLALVIHGEGAVLNFPENKERYIKHIGRRRIGKGLQDGRSNRSRKSVGHRRGKAGP